MKDHIERAPHIGRYVPRHLASVPDAPAEQVIAETAKRERESKDPRYLSMIDAAIERARGI